MPVPSVVHAIPQRLHGRRKVVGCSARVTVPQQSRPAAVLDCCAAIILSAEPLAQRGLTISSALLMQAELMQVLLCCTSCLHAQHIAPRLPVCLTTFVSVG